jgi:hypothetical protein
MYNNQLQIADNINIKWRHKLRKTYTNTTTIDTSIPLSSNPPILSTSSSTHSVTRQPIQNPNSTYIKHHSQMKGELIIVKPLTPTTHQFTDPSWWVQEQNRAQISGQGEVLLIKPPTERSIYDVLPKQGNYHIEHKLATDELTNICIYSRVYVCTCLYMSCFFIFYFLFSFVTKNRCYL